ncbi:MAG: prepilin-type N-terminal cleavage/methylation domain-containing protein [Candidatus Adiutrix sp.]|jgi:type IV pilus modification protein PilV|nr:prepilin-type N-terminal cleavage/methylation domain-containing protein [Candidatus Adiutrix sp.]
MFGKVKICLGKVKDFARRGRLNPIAGSGFTLIEVLVTLLVITLGCLGALRLQITALRGNAQADGLTVAGFLAESEIERLKALPFEGLAVEVRAHSGAPVTRSLNRQGQACSAPRDPRADCSGSLYQRTTAYFPQRPSSLSHQVEVEVRWRDAHGPHRVFYSAALTDFSF